MPNHSCCPCLVKDPDGAVMSVAAEGAGKKATLARTVVGRAGRLPSAVCRNIWKVARDDPRRVAHALKVGLSLTLVSFLYLLEPLFQGVGQNAMWAVMTVVVVLEFTAGATLCKGLNRGLGTLAAASLAFFIEFIAQKSGRVFRAVFIGAAVFLIGFISTYIRFFPHIKKNYEYGVVIFLLTFNLLTVSSFRVLNVIYIARQRLYTIAIGCGLCLFMSLLIFPIWSGEDLHNSTVRKLEGLARSIEACVGQYFNDTDQAKTTGEESLTEAIQRGYRPVLDSKSSDESLAMFASWEPRHSRHCFKFPGKQYVKLGAVLRHFGYAAVALHGCLESEIQTPHSVRCLFREPCMQVAGELSRVLKELAASIRNRRHCSPELLSDHLHEALQDLNSALKSQPRLFLGSRNAYARPALAPIAPVDSDPDKATHPGRVSLPSMKTDNSALLEWKARRQLVAAAEPPVRKTLRPTLSKIAITSLEFSEALPFAAFASLLVEMVARLELVIGEVEELARAAAFKEFTGEGDDLKIDVDGCDQDRRSGAPDPMMSHTEA